VVLAEPCSAHLPTEAKGDQEQQLDALMASQLTAWGLGGPPGQMWVAEELVATQLLAQLESVEVVEHESPLLRGHHQHPHLQIHSS
jgi:hypothetical protein